VGQRRWSSPFAKGFPRGLRLRFARFAPSLRFAPTPVVLSSQARPKVPLRAPLGMPMLDRRRKPTFSPTPQHPRTS